MKCLRSVTTVAAISVAVLSGCAANGTPTAVDGDAPAASSGPTAEYVNADALVQAFSATQYDYEPADDISEIRDASTRSFSGTLKSVGLSRTDGAPGNELEYTAVAVKEESTGETLWLELNIIPEAVRDVLVTGMPVAGFISPRQVPNDLPSSNVGSIIPAGANVWTTSIEGFALQYGRDEGVVVPFTQGEYPEIEADDILTELPSN